MITYLAILLISAVVLLTFVQTILVIQYFWFHRDAEETTTLDSSKNEAPKAAIILCLRGYEELIPECLAGLIGQDYPDFELHIAFDCESDKAVNQVKDFFQGSTSSVHLHFFEPREDCSFKCSGIVHVLEQLSEDIEIVAFCDCDAIVDENWLSELAMPLIDDPQIGATTGNRWFTPYDQGIGGLIRKLWNAAAVVQMQAYDIAWGGSMALRRSTIEECGLREVWAKSFCEDTSLAKPLKRKGKKLHRIPGLVIENRESTKIGQCYEWISRQMLTVRLHHPKWALVMGHGFMTLLATIVAPIAMVLLFVNGYPIECRSLLFAWAIYQVLNFVLLQVIERCNQEVLAKRNPAANDESRNNGGMIALLLVQFVHPLAFLKTWMASSVSWRGVKYAIRGRGVRVRHRG